MQGVIRFVSYKVMVLNVSNDISKLSSNVGVILDGLISFYKVPRH